MVYRIGIVLALDSHARIVGVATSRLGYGATARKPVTGVDHSTCLRRENGEFTACCLLAQFGNLLQDIGLPIIEHKEVVVATEILNMVKLRSNAN